ncbi:hypothetical protein C1Y63_10520 [Corynebacterium sp. 13CS0277]|uniref:hypothetical protein n=1 Tax=Corynebacterium sp. 13CS0277 TaxID=2071994 RepID=UPI000D02C5B9|nr:hypothetical protein [Corynebacterium sp. 13CS0277]PRQ10620.1 hypothetical protein C1Y63_10520 [Corynebacterium sp. 13CS0277]
MDLEIFNYTGLDDWCHEYEEFAEEFIIDGTDPNKIYIAINAHGYLSVTLEELRDVYMELGSILDHHDPLLKGTQMSRTPYVPTTEGRIWAEAHTNDEAQIYFDDGVLLHSVTMGQSDAAKFFAAGHDMFRRLQFKKELGK